jgi:hypothetical protein
MLSGVSQGIYQAVRIVSPQFRLRSRFKPRTLKSRSQAIRQKGHHGMRPRASVLVNQRQGALARPVPSFLAPYTGRLRKATLSGDGFQSAHLGSADDREGNGSSHTNQQVCEVGTPASFRPVNLWSRSGSGVVGLRAQASRPLAATTSPPPPPGGDDQWQAECSVSGR